MRTACTPLSQRTLQADAKQIVAEDALRAGQHAAHGGQVLHAVQHADRLRPLARKQERHRRHRHRLGNSQQLEKGMAMLV